MEFEIELLPIKESKRFRVNINPAMEVDYRTGEPKACMLVEYIEVCYGTKVTLDRIKEYWDKVSDPDKEILEYCERLKQNYVFHSYTRDEEVGIKYSNDPEVKRFLKHNPEFFEPGYLKDHDVSIPGDVNIPKPHLVVEQIGTTDYPDFMNEIIRSARETGKTAYLESREVTAKRLKEVA